MGLLHRVWIRIVYWIRLLNIIRLINYLRNNNWTWTTILNRGRATVLNRRACVIKKRIGT
jgi:hypothetical protein